MHLKIAGQNRNTWDGNPEIEGFLVKIEHFDFKWFLRKGYN